MSWGMAHLNAQEILGLAMGHISGILLLSMHICGENKAIMGRKLLSLLFSFSFPIFVSNEIKWFIYSSLIFFCSLSALMLPSVISNGKCIADIGSRAESGLLVRSKRKNTGFCRISKQFTANTVIEITYLPNTNGDEITNKLSALI